MPKRSAGAQFCSLLGCARLFSCAAADPYILVVTILSAFQVT